MGYDLWTQIVIQNTSDRPLSIHVLKLQWGKLYNNGDKDADLNVQDVDGHVIAGKDSFSIYGCGNFLLLNGTQGSFDIYDDITGSKIRSATWLCPRGSDINSFMTNDPVESWVFDKSGGSASGGALGTVTLKAIYMGS